MITDDKPMTIAKPSTAYPPTYRVWMASGIRCPHCRRQLRATDVRVDRNEGALTCQLCHNDLILVERN